MARIRTIKPVITYAVEPWTKIVDELSALFPDHYAEIATDKEMVPLDPDYETYAQSEAAGVTRVFTVRDNGKLVGYHVYFVRRGLHYKSTMFATTDMFYLKPQYRGSGIGKAFFQFAEAELKKMGVKKIFSGHKENFDLSGLFKSLGYKPTDRFYSKII